MLLVFSLALTLTVSTFVGAVVFIMDIRSFKSEKQMSLPRRKLIESILAEQELQRLSTEKVINDIEQSEEQNKKECDF